MTSKPRCDLCNLPLFRYAYKHNGEEKVAYRCQTRHGQVDANGATRPHTMGRKVVKIKSADDFLRGAMRLNWPPDPSQA